MIYMHNTEVTMFHFVCTIDTAAHYTLGEKKEVKNEVLMRSCYNHTNVKLYLRLNFLKLL